MTDRGDHFIPLKDDNLSLRVSPPKSRSAEKRSDAASRNKKKQNNQTNELPDIFHLPLGDLLLNIKTGIIVTDADDNLIWVNNHVIEYPYFGSEIGAIIEKAILNKPAVYVLQYLQEFVVHPGPFAACIRELLEKKKNFFGEEILLRDGKVCNLDYIPVSHQGKFQGAIWNLKVFGKVEDDYTHHTNDPLIEILDRFKTAYCEINMDGGIAACSPYFCSFTGYRKEELLKLNFIDLCGSGQQEIIDLINKPRSELSAKSTFSCELEIVLRNGTCKWMQCNASRVPDKNGKQLREALLLTEITEQKNIQQELENARKIAEHAQAAQQQFLASMSHDIRTPLNAIIGMTFLMEDTELNNEQHEYVKVLKNASNILLGLLNGVLDFAKIEAGKQEVHQREFDLQKLLLSLVETFSFKLNEKPVKLFCDIDPRIDHILMGDDILLNQILMNLLSNAEKFTAKGEIRLKVSVIKEYENNIWIEFIVEDTGIGISKEKLKEIFHDFIQADDDIRLHYGGSGLGLFICKKLVEMLGGEIAVDSIRDKGTSFVFTLPFVLTDQLLKKNEAAASTQYIFDKENICVLVVEDNPMNLKYLSSLLRKYHISFDIATDGKYALKKAKEKYYNLILMDMKLPKMSGMDVAAYIREKQTFNMATPIVLVSAAAFQSTVDKAKEVGVNELLAKPYSPDQLMSILKKYLIEDEDEEEITGVSLGDSTFNFDERLDVAYLHKLYGGNCSYAQSLFEVFIECMDKDWRDMQQAEKDGDWQQLKNLVHKVKPNFAMVGLTGITRMMQEVYDYLKKDNYESAVGLIKNVQAELDEYMPLVEEELHRMQKYTAQEVS